MRRGLMGWNADELPLAALAQRLDRMRAAMQRGGLDALLVYTNLVRPGAVSYLTGFTPYWSEGLLLVGRGGAPVFATALSKRVAEWIRSVSPAAEITNTPRPGSLFGQRLAADSSVRRVGILELDALPSGAYDDLVAAAPDLVLVDATKLFAEARRGADGAEFKLIARADAIAVAALNQVGGAAANDAGTLAGLVEKHARLAGAEEAYIAIAPDLAADRRMIRASPALPLGSVFALRASIAYKGQWVRRTRTFATDERAQRTVTRADDWLAALARAIETGKPLGAQIAARVKGLNGAALRSWMAESCLGSYPLQVVASSDAGDETPRDGDFLVLTLALSIDATPWLGAAPTIIGQRLA